jgi:hypothetical protein
MSMIVALLGLAAAVTCYALYHMNARMNMDLASYTLFLLLSGDGVQDHQKKIIEFVRRLDEPDEVSAVLRTKLAVQRMADDMAHGLSRGGFTLALAARIRDLRGKNASN